MLSVTLTDVQLNWDTSMSLQGETETENKQSVDNCLLDRVATVDSRLVSEILCTTDCVVLLQRDVVSVSMSPSRPTNVSSRTQYLMSRSRSKMPRVLDCFISDHFVLSLRRFVQAPAVHSLI